MSDCERCLSLLDSYIDHELAEDERLFVEKHLEQCSQCQAKWQEAMTLEEMLAEWAAQEIEPPMDFREKLFARLEAESAPVVPLAARAAKKKPSLNRILPWAAAAVLLLALGPAILHMTSSQPENASQPQQIAENDQTQPDDAPLQTPAEITPADEQPVDQEKQKAQDEPRAKEPPQSALDTTEQEDTGGTPSELILPTNDNDVADGETPMLASEPKPAEEQAPTEETKPQMPSPALYRSAVPEELDWQALKEQEMSLKQQYSQELQQLKKQYAQEATAELEAAITAKEAELAAVDKRLKAIDAKDAQAYDEALENTDDE